jgi:proline dehydrogenase
MKKNDMEELHTLKQDKIFCEEVQSEMGNSEKKIINRINWPGVSLRISYVGKKLKILVQVFRRIGERKG